MSTPRDSHCRENDDPGRVNVRHTATTNLADLISISLGTVLTVSAIKPRMIAFGAQASSL